MKRKVKKFQDGGIASQALTMAPSGMGSGGGLSGLQQNANDIASGAGAIEQGLSKIKGGGNSPYPFQTTSPLGVLGSTMMGSQRGNLGSLISAAGGTPYSKTSPLSQTANSFVVHSKTFKKGGRVKTAKPTKAAKKTTKHTRGDGCITKGRTKGRMV